MRQRRNPPIPKPANPAHSRGPASRPGPDWRRTLRPIPSLLALIPLVFLALLPAPVTRAATQSETDVVVYGATSGGAIAAIAAARLGKSVALVHDTTHIGGMTSSGLGVTDVGQVGSIRGFADEFYRRVGLRYGTSQPTYFFEPRIAESVFRQLLNEAGVTVHTNERLARVSTTNSPHGPKITGLHTEQGSRFQARMFIDTTYEGDLLAAAGVSFTVGREGTNAYGESLAGVRPPSATYAVDPYVIPGQPGSGLIPHVHPDTLAPAGAGDAGLQAYNFRLCLTQNPTNRVSVTDTPPEGYEAGDYELVARYIEARLAADGAVSLNQLLHIQQLIPNGKTDINANGEVSTDFVGASHAWATSSPSERAGIQRRHERYLRGLLYFLGTHPRVPHQIRTNMQSWGLARDEFVGHSNWPPQLYVREARRMVSDYVMRQQNCDGREIAPNPIALASYAIDSHAVHRIARDGAVRSEGGLFVPVSQPFPISYQSIIPRAGECPNLFATFALSASHVSFASCRMEPVFMMTSQAAGTAAALAIELNVPTQDLPHPRLAAQLRADGQLLGWTSGPLTTNGLVVDNSAPGSSQSGSWTTGANPGFWGSGYLHDQNAGKGAKSVRFTPNLPVEGLYDVFTWHVAAANRATNVPVDVAHATGTTRVLVNQTLNGSRWVHLLRTNFPAGTAGSVTIRTDDTAGFVIADAVRFLPAFPFSPPKPIVEIVAADPAGSEAGPDRARFAFVRQGDTSDRLPLRLAFSGSANLNVDYSLPFTNVSFGSGHASLSLPLTPAADALSEPDETVTITLLPSDTYEIGPLHEATIRLRDGNSLPPRLRLISSPVPGQVIVEFDAAPERSYRVEQSEELVPSFWVPVAEFPAAPIPRTLRLTNDPGPLPQGPLRRFYRLATP